MRSRMIDIALLVGLVAVSGGILWTLFTLGREPRVAGTTPQPPAASSPAPAASSAGAPAGTDARAPDDTAGGASAGARGVVAIDPDDEGEPSDGSAAASDVAAVGDTGATAPGPAEGTAVATPAAPPRVLPSGTLELERVGYSFVTGGAGACGVVLEAWTHVAVSRDLLETYGCGAEVTVTLDDPVEGRTEVAGVIGDTMNPSFSMTVNVYVGEDEPAFDYGLTTGTFRARE